MRETGPVDFMALRRLAIAWAAACRLAASAAISASLSATILLMMASRLAA
ncbi:MAG: hypothetical protein NTV52_02270 [Acidobacteria bacterium]|nr:hypothetical protein [Acidobacteriota bacterium]